jgi:hypothetical protein
MSLDTSSAALFTKDPLVPLVATPRRRIAVAASLVTAVASLLKFLTGRRPLQLAIVFAAPVLVSASCGRQPSNKPIPPYIRNDGDSNKQYGLVEHAAATAWRHEILLMASSSQ